MANAPIADFFIFVPDDGTLDLLQRLMPSLEMNAAININLLQVVGDLVTFYHSRLGSTLDAANFEFSGKTISRLKPMLAYVFEDYIGNDQQKLFALGMGRYGYDSRQFDQVSSTTSCGRIRCDFYERSGLLSLPGRRGHRICVRDSRWPSRDSWWSLPTHMNRATTFDMESCTDSSIVTMRDPSQLCCNKWGYELRMCLHK